VGAGALADVAGGPVAGGPAVEWTPRLSQTDVARALDESTCLVLPSRSEGMGRVVVEAFCRGRPVVGSRVGGIPDLVEDGANGLLVDPEDVAALGDALRRVLTDHELAERLARGAEASAELCTMAPPEFSPPIPPLLHH